MAHFPPWQLSEAVASSSPPSALAPPSAALSFIPPPPARDWDDKAKLGEPACRAGRARRSRECSLREVFGQSWSNRPPEGTAPPRASGGLGLPWSAPTLPSGCRRPQRDQHDRGWAATGRRHRSSAEAVLLTLRPGGVEVITNGYCDNPQHAATRRLEVRDKKRLQTALFPEGVTYLDGDFRTPASLFDFRRLAEKEGLGGANPEGGGADEIRTHLSGIPSSDLVAGNGAEGRMVHPRGFEPLTS